MVSLSVPQIAFFLRNMRNVRKYEGIHRNKLIVQLLHKQNSYDEALYETAALRLGGEIKEIYYHKKMKTHKESGDALIKYVPFGIKEGNYISRAKAPILYAGHGIDSVAIQTLGDLYTIHEHFREKRIHHPITYAGNYIPELVTPNIRAVFAINHQNAAQAMTLISTLVQLSNINIHILPRNGWTPPWGIISKLMYSLKMSQSDIVVSLSKIRNREYDIVYNNRNDHYIPIHDKSLFLENQIDQMVPFSKQHEHSIQARMHMLHTILDRI